jgi:hypothetical protein
VVGCNNARTKHNEGHIAVVKELIKNDVIVLTTGCNGIACAMEGLLTPESAQVYCGPGLAEVCETVGIPPVLHLGSCVDNSRILLAATEVVNADGLGSDISELPAAGCAPEWISEKEKKMDKGIHDYHWIPDLRLSFAVVDAWLDIQNRRSIEHIDPLHRQPAGVRLQNFQYG